MDDGFGYWLSGFIDGEASFSITRHQGQAKTYHQCVFRISLRDDDKRLMEEIHRITGLGSLSPGKAYGNSKPQIYWQVGKQADCLRLVEILDRYPLRSRKSDDYAVWREAVLFWVSTNDTTRRSEARQEKLSEYKSLLEDARRYKE